MSLRLVRTGGKTTGYFYSNGGWIKQGSVSLVPPSFELNGGYIGLAVTAHAAPGVITTASFDTDLVDAIPIPLP